MTVQRANNAGAASTASAGLVSADTGGASGDQLTIATIAGSPTITAEVFAGRRWYVVTVPTSASVTAHWNDTCATGYDRAHFRHTSGSGATTYFVMRAQGSGGNNVEIHYSTAGEVVVKNAAAATVYTSTAGLVPLDGSEFCLEYAVDNGTGTTDGRCRVRLWTGAMLTPVVDVELTGQNFFRSGGITSRRLGKLNTTGAVTYRFSHREIGNTYSLPGPARFANFDVIIGVGQSNMRGAADDWTQAADYFDQGVYQWDAVRQQIVSASEGLFNEDSTSGQYMGAVNRFARAYIAAGQLATGRSLLVVMTARGGTGFSTPDSNGTQMTWQVDDTDGSHTNLWAAAQAKITAGMTAAGTGSRVVAVLANHGSTDGINNIPKATYKPRVEAFIDAIRGWLHTQGYTPTATVRYCMMQMRPDLLAAEARHRDLDDAQQELAASKPGVRHSLSPVGSTYYKGDSVHFNAAGQRLIGAGLYTAWAAADPSPPVLGSVLRRRTRLGALFSRIG